MKKPKCRFTVEFPDKINKMIESLAENEGVSKIDILKQSISLYDYIKKEIGNKPDCNIAICQGDKIIKQIVMT